MRVLSIAGWLAASVWLPVAALAEVHEVKMLNRGAAGAMVFEPAVLQIAVGDTVKFIASDRSHNAEIIAGMLPNGAEGFKGGVNEEIEVSFPIAGAYAYKCAPHFSMGMVGLIIVGVPDNLQSFADIRLPPLARKKIDSWIAALPAEG